MARKSTVFVCSSCGYESPSWYGKCPECGSWNTLEEISVEFSKGASSNPFITDKPAVPQKLTEIKSLKNSRVSTTLQEFDRVLGGGIVPGSVVLLAGDPGIGKSTLLLQLVLKLGAKNTVLYVSGEESESQIKMRAERILPQAKSKSNSLILSTTSVDSAVAAIDKAKPQLVVIDSIQTIGSSAIPGFPGSVPQVRYSTAKLVSLAKQKNIPIFIVGHVTKEGMVAGPMLLSHMVDTVLYLEGEDNTSTRVLRAFKNRFGDASEVGIFVMEEGGLTEITDAKDFFMESRNAKVPGSALAVVMEGSRPLLVEIQALVVPTTFNWPRRVANGISEKRLELLLAVIQKTVKIPVERMDVFVNVAGGLKIHETASDLAVCAAVISSYKGLPLASPVAIGEVGLLGEVKKVPRLDARVKEARKFGNLRTITADSVKYVSEIYGRK